jgi:hypothetical protein
LRFVEHLAPVGGQNAFIEDSQTTRVNLTRIAKPSWETRDNRNKQQSLKGDKRWMP